MLFFHLTEAAEFTHPPRSLLRDAELPAEIAHRVLAIRLAKGIYDLLSGTCATLLPILDIDDENLAHFRLIMHEVYRVLRDTFYWASGDKRARFTEKRHHYDLA